MYLGLNFEKTVSIKVATLSIGILILQACSSVSSDWKTAQTLNTQHSYKDFIREHPKSPQASKAYLAIDNIIWDSISKINTEEKYKWFIKEYPKSSHLMDARKNLEGIVWNNAQKNNSVKDYGKFIKDYGMSQYIPETKNKLDKLHWKVAKDKNSISSYFSYIKALKKGTIEGNFHDAANQKLNAILGESQSSKKDMKEIIKEVEILLTPYSLQDVYKKGTHRMTRSAFESSSEFEVQTNSDPVKTTSLLISAGENVQVAHSLGKKGYSFLMGFPKGIKYWMVANLIGPRNFTDENGKTIGFFEEIFIYTPDGTIKNRYINFKDSWYTLN